MSNKSLLLGAVCAAVAAAPAISSAAIPVGDFAGSIASENLVKADDVFALEVSAGLLSGGAKEHVFDKENYVTEIVDGRRHQISRLDWDMKNIPVVGLGATLRINERLTLNAGVWGAVDASDDDGDMDDYDWLKGDDVPYSEYSKSTSDLTSGVIVDVHLAYDFVQDWNGLSASFVVGARGEEWKWEAMDLYALYSENNYVPVFESGKVCEYRQTYISGYVGLSAEWRIGDLALSGLFTWGRYYAEDEDDHILADKHFEETFDQFDADAIRVGVAASYAFTERMSARLAYDYFYYGLSVGTMELWDYDEGTYGKEDDASGIEMRYGIVSVALSFTF